MLPIFDGHNDTLLRLYRYEHGASQPFFASGGVGHLDLPRARAGGLGGGFFAIFVPTGTTREGVPLPTDDDITFTDDGYTVPLAAAVPFADARHATLAMMGTLAAIVAESAGEVRLMRDADELASCLRDGILAVVLHFEGAEAIAPDLADLPAYYRDGLRSLGIVWSRPNAFGHGVPFRFPASPDTGPGLTDAGHRLVDSCNRMGIMLDLAHLNERGFWDVARLSQAPLVVTHAGAHTLCPSTRNLTDRQLDAIAASDGVVGVAFDPTMLRADGMLVSETPLAEIVRHIAYIATRIGVEHVALGSDFDGAVVPLALGDVAGLPLLVAALREHGYDDATLRQIASENWLRVLRATWRA